MAYKTDNRFIGLRIGWELNKSKLKSSNKIICKVCGKKFHRRGKRKNGCKTVSCSKVCKKIATSKIPNSRKGFKSGSNTNCKNCGKSIYKFPSVKIRKFCSIKCRDEDGSTFRRGSNHYRWNGGCKQNRKIDLNLRRWRRELIKERGRLCRVCGCEERVMYADHILPWADFPKHRYLLSNGQILCGKHHREKTREENKNRNRKGKLIESYKCKIITAIQHQFN